MNRPLTGRRFVLRQRLSTTYGRLKLAVQNPTAAEIIVLSTTYGRLKLVIEAGASCHFTFLLPMAD